MSCPRCGFVNAPASSFCGSCGAALAHQCRVCGAEVDPQLRFCTSCGTAVAEASNQPDDQATADPTPGRARPSAERRLVSVLFLDLVGFTQLAESLDPEEVRDIQSRYFESARATVAHYGGSLEKFIGDAVMAVWGSPIAHEDDGERAVRAALEIVAEVGTMLLPSGAHLAARGAVTTGEAAVSLDAVGQGMVTGDLVNTAARLQDTAGAGSVLVDAATQSVIRDGVTFEAAGERTLKGKTAPVRAWRAVTLSVPADRHAPGAHGGPFVGRSAELDALGGLLHATAAGRRMHVVSVIGIAGIGKSRLAWELEHVAAAGPSPPNWYTGRAPAYGERIAFSPLAEMVRRSAGIVEGGPIEMSRRSLQAALARLIPDPGERAWVEPRLSALLEPQLVQAPREELFAAWRRYFEAIADVAPLVLVFEDLQWADVGLLDFIDYPADWSRHRPILILTLGRPELHDERPGWGASMPQFTATHLDRLPDAAIDELLGVLAPGLEPTVARRVRERADGVALYAVEMARMLAERGSRSGPSSARRGDVEAIDIPESLHALIAARIDALPRPQRSLLLMAAALGRRFRPDTLRALTGEPANEFEDLVRALVRREFLAVDDEPRSPGRGQLSFVQELVREVAYHTLSRRERGARHLAIVRHLESLDEPESIEPIAEHLVAAHAAARGTEQSQLRERVRNALRSAADRAETLHAPERALLHLERALALTDDPRARAELSEAAGLAARAAARFEAAEAHLREAIRLHDTTDDTVAAARQRAQLASLLLQAQRSDAALSQLEAAWSALPEDIGADAIAIEVPAQIARAHLLRGDSGKAVAWAERALRGSSAAESAQAAASIIDARITLSTARAGTRDGMQQLRDATGEAAKAGLGAVELRGRNNLAWLMVGDDPRATYRTAREGLELARRLGNREMALQLLDAAALVAIDTGDWSWATESLEKASANDIPAIYRLDFAVTRTMLNALRGIANPTAPIDQLGSLESDLDAQALASLDHARALVAMMAGDLDEALAHARAAVARTTAFERAAALSLTGRLATWTGERPVASEALAQLTRESENGRASQAAQITLRAAVAALEPSRSRTKSDDPAGRDWELAVHAWTELDLPLRLGLCLLDRWRLRRDRDDAAAATRIFEALEAAPLVELVARRDQRPRR
jgi:class 3 adenylate cyclase/tetratricopeptide (TPR) repeat protein